jgi:DNA polymerase III delta subunit
VLAKSPQSPYPVYQLLLKADKFSLAELFAALSKAQAVDRHLKGGRLSPALVLEDLLLSICRP